MTKKNMNTSYTMYTLKSKLLKKHTLLHLNITCISTWMVTQKNSIINSMYLYVAYNCIPLTCLVTVTKLRHSTGSLYMNGEQFVTKSKLPMRCSLLNLSSFTCLSMELLTMFLIYCVPILAVGISSQYAKSMVNPLIHHWYKHLSMLRIIVF